MLGVDNAQDAVLGQGFADTMLWPGTYMVVAKAGAVTWWAGGCDSFVRYSPECSYNGMYPCWASPPKRCK